jgi:hypothetical protein
MVRWKTPDPTDDPGANYDKVKLLFDYTKFHIGLYTTLGTLFVGVLTFSQAHLPTCSRVLLWLGVICVGVAGLAGGVIASTLPHMDSIQMFWTKRLGPFGSERVSLTGENWTYLEHGAFWAGLLLAAAAFFARSPDCP